MKVRFSKVNPNAIAPPRATVGASGLDLYACLSTRRLYIEAGNTYLIGTGIALELPDGYEAQVRPRSGVTVRGLIAAFGTVDSDYRGEISVVVHNVFATDLVVVDGDRIAQLVIVPVPHVELVEVSEHELSPTARGRGGFGSTGK